MIFHEFLLLHDSLHATSKGDLIKSLKAMIQIDGSEESENEECFGVYSEAESEEDEEEELPASESDSDGPRGRKQEEEYEVEPVFPSSNEEETHEPSPSPEREVTFTQSASKNARRNARRRQQKKILRNQVQHDASKTRTDLKKKHGSERKDPFLRLGPPTSSTEILSDSDARAGRRPDNNNDKKRRRESQESVEEVDSQGRKVPTNKYKYQQN